MAINQKATKMQAIVDTAKHRQSIATAKQDFEQPRSKNSFIGMSGVSFS